MWIPLALILSLYLALSLGLSVESGCVDWKHDPSNSAWVCCQRCNSGNRLVHHCGPDPKALCAPCERETYTNGTMSWMCQRCTQCIGPLRVKRECSASSDTVCECAPGLLCADSVCSFCVKQCGKGEEPSEKRGCRPCPSGTFNDQIHHHCTKWSSRCPSANQQIVAAGTAISDIVCGDLNAASPSPTIRPASETSSPVLSLVLSIICAFVFAISTLMLCASVNLKRKMVKTAPVYVETSAAGQRQTPEPEHCSLCFPQEEHGSSNGSSNGSQSSLLCDDKPFELVV